MKYHKHTLSNGVRLLITPVTSLESFTLTVWVRVGSRYEETKIGGISHFLEHMVFKGSEKRPSAQLIASSVDAIGGEFNAATSKEWTNFYIKGRSEVVETAFDVLSDMVLRPLIKEDDLEREKGVILEEMAMYEDTPRAKIGDVFEQLIFKGTSLGEDIIGTKKSVKAITRDDFLKYRDTHYFSENILITISGGIAQERAIELANKYFSKVISKKQFNQDPVEITQKAPQILLSNKGKEQANFIIGFLGNKLKHKDRYIESVLSSILGGGMSSRLFTEIREKRGLAYAVKTGVERYIDTGYIETYAGVDPKKALEAIKVTLDQLYGLRDSKFKITNEELKKAKEYIKGHLALSLEDTRDINHFFGEEEIVSGETRTLEEVYKGIDKVEIDDLIRVSKEIFVPSKLNLAIIGPYKSQVEFEKAIK